MYLFIFYFFAVQVFRAQLKDIKTMRIQIRINKWPFSDRQNNSKTKVVNLSHLQPIRPYLLQPQQLLLAHKCMMSSSKRRMLPFGSWLTNALLRHTHCKQLSEWGVCRLIRCLWNYKEILDVTAHPLGYVSIMKSGEGHQSTSPGRLKCPDSNH